ncbi:hypothetical protein K0M31_019723, partial [Melipona bicolor]
KCNINISQLCRHFLPSNRQITSDELANEFRFQKELNLSRAANITSNIPLLSKSHARCSRNK